MDCVSNINMVHIRHGREFPSFHDADSSCCNWCPLFKPNPILTLALDFLAEGAYPKDRVFIGMKLLSLALFDHLTRKLEA